MRKGERWNESVLLRDCSSAKLTRRLTDSGLYNETPTYHSRTAFSSDSRYLVFATAREGGSALMRADTETGELMVLSATDGIGAYGYHFSDRYWSPYASGSLGGGYTGHYTALVQNGDWVASCVGKRLMVAHLHTMEERVLIENIGREYRFGHPIGSVDGRKVLVPLLPEHPELAAGNARPRRSYVEACIETWGGLPTTFLQIDIETAATKEVFHDAVHGSQRIQPCPNDPELWLIDRDLPPKFWMGGDGNTPRAWLLHTGTKQLRELRPHDRNPFFIHTNWNKDGTRIYYQGLSAAGGTYLGASDVQGKVLWEEVFAASHYGHVSPHMTREAIIVDSILTEDLITAIYYEELDGAGAPRIELLARHGTQWKGLTGQYAHPHCQMSPDGRWLSYNRCENGHTNVFLVHIREGGGGGSGIA